jgi:hypothetical protein
MPRRAAFFMRRDNLGLPGRVLKRTYETVLGYDERMNSHRGRWLVIALVAAALFASIIALRFRKLEAPTVPPEQLER